MINKKNLNYRNEKAHDYYVASIKWCAFLMYLILNMYELKKFYIDKIKSKIEIKNYKKIKINKKISTN